MHPSDKKKSQYTSLYVILILIAVTRIQIGRAQPCNIDIGKDFSICQGQNTTLVAKITPGNETYNYSWTSVPAGTYANNDTINVSPTTTTRYTVTINGSGPCNNLSDAIVVTVNTLPVADFAFTPNNQCSPINISFTNTSSGSGSLTYNWNFGDPGSGANNISNLRNPSHIFSSIGNGVATFNVSLTVTDVNGCSSAQTKQILVRQMPDASMEDSAQTWKHCVSGSNITGRLKLNNTSTTISTNTHYHIDWGDLSPHYDANSFPDGILHEYTTIGNFKIVLTVSNSQCSASKTYYFFNGSNPQGGIVNPGNTQGLCGVPQTINYTFSPSIANNPPGTIYTITYDDGSPNEVYPQPPPAVLSHTFTAASCNHVSQTNNIPNSYAIKCIISNPCGQSLSVIDPIQISQKPVASFTPNPPPIGCINTNITFRSATPPVGFIDPGTNTCSNFLSHLWTITPATYTIVSGSKFTNDITVNFTAAGNYTVTLKETNSCGSDEISASICINSPTVSSFNLDKIIGCKPLTVAATSTSSTPNTCNDLRYNWTAAFNGSSCLPSSGSWAPGTIQTTRDASFTFTDPGTYAINYTVQNSCGITSSTKNITVKAPPTVSVNSLPSICSGSTINPSAVFNDCYGTISTYNWLFPGGTPSSTTLQTPPSITYLNPGSTAINSVVSVMATNECGTGTGSSNPFTVFPLSQVRAGNDTLVCVNSGSFQLIGTPAGGTWSGTNVTAAGIFSPIIPGSYILTYTGGGFECPTKDERVVTVAPRPVVDAGTDKSFCLNSGLQNLSGTPSGGVWSGPGITNAATGSFNPVVSGVGTFSLTYTFTDPVTKCSNSDFILVTVLPVPTVVANDLTICNQPIPVQLTATPTGGNWSGPGVSIGGLYTPNGTGNFVLTYTYTDIKGCSNSDQMILSVIEPTLVNAGNDTSVCVNSGSFMLIGTPAGGTWSGTNVNSAGLFSTTAAGTYTLTYSMGGGNCLTKDERVVTVVPRPVVDAGTDKSFCLNSGLQTLSGTPSSGVWSGPGITNAATGSFNPMIAGAGTFSLTYTYTDPVTKCSNSDFILVTVLPVPTVVANDLTICNQPIPVQLTATPAGGNWSGPGVSIGGLYTPNGTGSFVLTYTYTDTKGCSNSGQMILAVIEPTLVNAGNDTSVCVNSGSFMLIGTPTGGTWSGTNVNSAGLFSTTTAGTYTLTYSMGGGNCLTKDERVVTVVPRPVVDAGTDKSFCFNSGLQTLSGTPAGGVWSGPGITDAATGSFNPVVSGVGTFSLTYTYTDAITNCSNFDALRIIVSDTTPIIVNNITVCNQPVGEQLTALPEGGVWSGPNVSPNGLFLPNGTGDFILMYTYTNSNNCTSSANMIVTVVNPDNTINAGNDTAICSYQSLSLSGYPAGGTWSGRGVSPGGFFNPGIAGNYWLIYSIGNGSCKVTDSLFVKVGVKPKADFMSNNVCLGDTTIFTDNSNGGGVNIASWNWKFGDTTTSHNQHPTHNYISTGPFYPRLLVTNQDGCIDSITKPIEVMTLPEPDFSFIIPACSNVPLMLKNLSTNAQSFVWDFGDGITSTNFEPIHIYTLEGTYLLKLKAFSDFGCVNSDSSNIVITGPPPKPLFNISAKEGCSPLTVSISIDTATYGKNYNYYWDFGNGILSNSLLLPDSLVYRGSLISDTIYYIRFVSYNYCDSLVYTDSILVHPKPYPQFEMVHNWDCSPIEVIFKNVSKGNSKSFTWDFGDGSNSTSRDPVHTFTTGTNSTLYNISLAADNSCGADTVMHQLLVKPNTVDAFFRVGNFRGCENDVFCFENFSTDTSSVGLTEISWNFGDGQISKEKNPCHIFKSAGLYNVKLHVDNGCGHDEMYDTITINPAPQIIITSNNEACLGENLLFNYSSNVDLAKISWDFGDQDSASLINPVHTYKAAGTFVVTAKGVSSGVFPACTGIASKQVTINPTPEVFILPDTSGCVPLEITFEGDAGSSHLWNFGDSPTFTSDPTHIFDSAGLFQVKLISENRFNCRAADSIKIKVYPKPSSNFTFTTSGGYPEYLSFVNTSTGATECNWDFGNGQVLSSCSVNGPIRYDFNDTYLISLLTRNEYGCTDISSKYYQVYFKGLFVPNAIIPEAPDADENLFLPKGIGLDEYTVQIFDSWGNKLWESSALQNGMPSEGWNGRNQKGEIYPQDVYVWRIRAKFADGTYWSGTNGKTYGTVTLIR